jgi:hypothetical protein
LPSPWPLPSTTSMRAGAIASPSRTTRGGARGRETTLIDEGRAVVDGNVGVEYVIFLNGYASDIYIICFHHPYLSSSPSTPPSTPSQHAKVDLKSLIVSVIPIYSLSDTINLFCLLCIS